MLNPLALERLLEPAGVEQERKIWAMDYEAKARDRRGRGKDAGGVRAKRGTKSVEDALQKSENVLKAADRNTGRKKG